MYKEIAEFRKSPEEVIGMFSEELRILDRNTTLYMLDQYSKELDEVVAARDKAVEARDKAEAKLDAAYALLKANGIPIPDV